MALGHRQWFIQSACATTGDGLYEAGLGFDHDLVTYLSPLSGTSYNSLFRLDGWDSPIDWIFP